MFVYFPSEKEIENTMNEISEMAKRDLEARRRLTFLKRTDTLMDKDGNLFVLEDGKLIPVDGD